jgi:hypothetical protein
MKSAYPFALACLMVAIAFELYMRCVFLLGFPDRFIAELDGAEAELATWFNWFCLAMAVWFVFLGWLSFRADIKRKLTYSCVLFLLVAGAAVALDLHFRSHMVDSRGG